MTELGGGGGDRDLGGDRGGGLYELRGLYRRLEPDLRLEGVLQLPRSWIEGDLEGVLQLPRSQVEGDLEGRRPGHSLQVFQDVGGGERVLECWEAWRRWIMTGGWG